MKVIGLGTLCSMGMQRVKSSHTESHDRVRSKSVKNEHHNALNPGGDDAACTPSSIPKSNGLPKSPVVKERQAAKLRLSSGTRE
jgi:hypothetical protein